MTTIGPIPGCCPALCAGTTAPSSSGRQSTQGKSVVVVCHKGQKLSEGTAAWLRHNGIEAQTLEGGFEAWKKAGELLVRTDKLPERDAQGRTVWVTRTRPKVDRIACPWLIRRFIDPNAVFLFVVPSEVTAVAERFKATPFDIEGVFWSHRGDTCTFDTMIEEFALKSQPLLELAKIVRGADTARPDLTPQSAGIAGGFTRLFAHVSRRPPATRGGDGALRRLLSLVPRRQRRNPQLAEHQTKGLT